MFFRFLSSFLLLFFTSSLSAERIVIYHTSDIHGWYTARRVSGPGGPRMMGGYAALSSLVEKETLPFLLLDSGDLYQGTPEGNFSKGMASIELMNLLGYTAGALGNHEYDYGEENVRRLAAAARFPFLAANIRVRSTDLLPDYAKPYLIVTVGRRKIGILGLANSTTPSQTLSSNVQGLVFQDELAAAARLVPEIRRQGVEAVVILVHGGISDSLSIRRLKVSADQDPGLPPGTLAIARAVPGIDVILGGHYHTGFEEGFRDPVSGTLIVESYQTLLAASRVELDFDEGTGRLESAGSRLIDLNVEETGEDPAVSRLLTRYTAEVEEVMGKVIGQAAENLDQPALATWINDVMREASGADIALQNPGGIRTEMHKGELTIGDIYRIMPFDNTVVTVELTGSEIVRLLKTTPMYVSGIEAKWPVDRNGKVVGVEVRSNGEEIPPNRIFRVATNNYLASGASEILTAGAHKTDTGQVIRDLMIEAVRKISPVRPSADRITRLPDQKRH